jgi:hypothetical protein
MGTITREIDWFPRGDQINGLSPSLFCIIARHKSSQIIKNCVSAEMQFVQVRNSLEALVE